MAKGQVSVEADGRPLGGGSDDHIAVMEVGDGLTERQPLLGAEVGGRDVVACVKASNADGCSTPSLESAKKPRSMSSAWSLVWTTMGTCARRRARRPISRTSVTCGAGRAVDQRRAGARHNRAPYLLPRGRSGFCCLHDDSPGSFSTICWCHFQALRESHSRAVRYRKDHDDRISEFASRPVN